MRDSRYVAAGAALAAMLLACAPACSSLPPPRVENEDARGTLAGSVHGPGGVAPVKGRQVVAVEVDTGRRYSTRTNDVGSYSLLVPPGRYRIEVALASGEEVVRDPGVAQVEPSQLIPEADVVLGGAGLADPE